MDAAVAAPQKPQDKPSSSNNTDGDHDSGVDESTQKKDGPTTNGDLGSPSKSSKIPAPKRLSMPSPTKSTKASPKTPEAPPTADKKKVPMNKIQVGSAPSPNLKTVKSKIGSLQNTTHKPGGGNIKIENRKLDWKAQPRIAAKNDTYQPGGGDKKITQVKLQWNAKPKIGSLENATHKPGGGDKKIESTKLDFKDKAKPKIGSLENATHKPGGGNVKNTSLEETQNGVAADIEDQKVEIKAQSKIGSLNNVAYKPGGGDKKIFDDKEYLRQMSGSTSKAGSEGIPSGTQGCSSASSSRRTSRERRCSVEPRYRSESRLGRSTPEPRVSPREEHHSLREKHDQQQEDLIKELQEPCTSPLRPTSTASEQTMTRSEAKDLNSNQTSGHSEHEENKKDGGLLKKIDQCEQNLQKSTNLNYEVDKSSNGPVEETLDNMKKNDDHDRVPKAETKKETQENNFQKELIKDMGNSDKDHQQLNKIESLHPKTSISKQLTEESLKPVRDQTLPKVQSKEDKVMEIKEIDCKEPTNPTRCDDQKKTQLDMITENQGTGLLSDHQQNSGQIMP